MKPKRATKKQKEQIEYLLEVLWKLRTAGEEKSLLSVDEVSWIDDSIDLVTIGFLNQKPDGDSQVELKKQKVKLSFEEALEEISVRLNNSIETL